MCSNDHGLRDYVVPAYWHNGIRVEDAKLSAFTVEEN